MALAFAFCVLVLLCLTAKHVVLLPMFGLAWCIYPGYWVLAVVGCSGCFVGKVACGREV